MILNFYDTSSELPTHIRAEALALKSSHSRCERCADPAESLGASKSKGGLSIDANEADLLRRTLPLWLRENRLKKIRDT